MGLLFPVGAAEVRPRNVLGGVKGAPIGTPSGTPRLKEGPKGTGGVRQITAAELTLQSPQRGSPSPLLRFATPPSGPPVVLSRPTTPSLRLYSRPSSARRPGSAQNRAQNPAQNSVQNPMLSPAQNPKAGTAGRGQRSTAGREPSPPRVLKIHDSLAPATPPAGGAPAPEGAGYKGCGSEGGPLEGSAVAEVGSEGGVSGEGGGMTGTKPLLFKSPDVSTNSLIYGMQVGI